MPDAGLVGKKMLQHPRQLALRPDSPDAQARSAGDGVGNLRRQVGALDGWLGRAGRGQGLALRRGPSNHAAAQGVEDDLLVAAGWIEGDDRAARNRAHLNTGHALDAQEEVDQETSDLWLRCQICHLQPNAAGGEMSDLAGYIHRKSNPAGAGGTEPGAFRRDGRSG